MGRKAEESRCHVCRRYTLSRTTEPFERVITHDGRTIRVRIPDLSVVKCMNPDCHPDDPSETVIFDGDALHRIDQETYHQLGLLTPDTIRAGRERLGMTQQELQELLRLGGNSLSRWESGAVFQSRSLDTLLRIVFQVPSVLSFLKQDDSEVRHRANLSEVQEIAV